jgi:hypothetical protein
VIEVLNNLSVSQPYRRVYNSDSLEILKVVPEVSSLLW